MNIVIVGGGTAGWLAAYCILKSQPKAHKITVIESSEIGIIGAGEGSTGFLIDVLTGKFFDHNIDLNEFIEFCDATNKMGIKFDNWLGNGQSFFTPLDLSPTGSFLNDYLLKYVLCKYGRNKLHLASQIGVDFEIDRNKEKITSLHFNAHKVGQFFKNICVKDNVTHIDGIVEHINQNKTNGSIESLILKDESKIEADFFIDATGFNRTLMKSLDVKWISYQKYLPLNSAMPFLLDYTENEKILPCTTATALSSGWMWNIPLKNRRGCGYVYNDNFLSKDDAKAEIENFLGRKIVPLKHISFDPGIAEMCWSKNVLSVGLASCFVEPLQATSIHTTIAQLLLFINDYLTDSVHTTVLPENQDEYNKKCETFYNLNLEFVSMHYQGGREDTPFWRYVKNESIVSPYAKEIITRSKNKILGYYESPYTFGAPAMGLWNWSLGGLGLLNEKTAYNDLINSNLLNIAETQYIRFIARSNEQRF
jgi:tryptophan halogenase